MVSKKVGNHTIFCLETLYRLLLLLSAFNDFSTQFWHCLSFIMTYFPFSKILSPQFILHLVYAERQIELFCRSLQLHSAALFRHFFIFNLSCFTICSPLGRNHRFLNGAAQLFWSKSLKLGSSAVLFSSLLATIISI